MTIRTPDQRLRIFVSSTLQELADERRAVRNAIEALRLSPVMFELGARPHPPRALYRAYLQQSDVFVGLYWQRYGWVAPGETLSGLEDEYRLAGDRPKLIYIKEPAAEREPRLSALLADVQADDDSSYRRFTSPEELSSLVADDLAVLVSERFASVPSQHSGASLLPPEERPLPRPLTRLINRTEDVQRLVDTLADASRRLVTIVGPGGVGKSRLALAVAEQVRTAYTNGVFFVPLATVREPGLLMASIARSIGIAEDRGAGAAILRRTLASAHCLILLDNLEQLVEAAPELADLLGATSRVQILATSRTVLNVRGEHVLELLPLELAAGRGGPSPAMELFLDRVADLYPRTRGKNADTAAIEELTRRLDGLPLAIELAAAQMSVFTPRALLQRIGHRRLEVLTTGPRDLPRRHKALRDSIGWSYELLDPAARRIFERLAVVVGSADLAAVEAIADPKRECDLVSLLGSLVEASLLRTTGDAGEVRFGMLETIREYANERLEATEEAEQVRGLHAEYYLRVAAGGFIGVRGSGQLEWLDRLDRESDNFRAVLRRAIRRGDAATGTRLGLYLSWFWQMRSLYTEGRAWMRAVREISPASGQARAAAWTIEAFLAIWQAEFEWVAAGVDEAIESLRGHGDVQTLGLALLLKGAVGGVDGGLPIAEEAVAEADALLSAQEDEFLRGIVLLGRSYVARREGRLDDAAQLSEQALAVSDSLGESYLRSVALPSLAIAALERGAQAEARGRAIEALAAARQLQNRSSAAYALELWAAAESREGRFERAALIYALAQRSYGLASALPPDARLHQSLAGELRRELGSGLDEVAVEVRAADLDVAISELTDSPPTG